MVGSPQPEVCTRGKNQWRALTKSGPYFIEYLEALLRAYPEQKILMIADNASFHHAQKVDPYVNEHHDRLEIKWLPPYCSDLNDIERTWRRLKANYASNLPFSSLDELIENVRKGIGELNATIPTN